MPESHYSCAVCDSTDGRFLFQYQNHDLYRCDRCTHVQVFPMPSEDELNDFYTQDKDSLNNSHTFRNLADYRSHPGLLHYFKSWPLKEFNRLLRSRHRKPKVLEIGAGCGIDLAILRDYYGLHNSTGIELNAHATKIGAETLKVDLRTSPPTPDALKDQVPFQGAFSIHVLEHLPNPKAYLAQALDCLDAGGVLYLNVPNYRSFQSRFLGKNWHWLMPPGHLHYFTPKSMKHLLTRLGMTKIKVYSEQNFFPGGYIADLVRIAKKLIRAPKETPDRNIPSASRLARVFPVLWIADATARILTFPLWIYMRLCHAGSCLIASAEKAGPNPEYS